MGIIMMTIHIYTPGHQILCGIMDVGGGGGGGGGKE